jgi:hypothetical protein
MPFPPYIFMHLPPNNPYIIKAFIFNPTSFYIYLTISFTYYQLAFKYCVHIPIVAIFFFNNVLITNEKSYVIAFIYLRIKIYHKIFNVNNIVLGKYITNVIQI